ncbi:MAG TPA: cytochrome b/b6 domain-containing protein [Anaerolineaceae bacterium]|nr:cytochrome b/b6 domain-containing protein [Anaerolineaceae bacterium]
MNAESKKITRFTLLQRIEHWLLFLSFTTLAVTGLSQKYALSGISDAIIGFLGGIENVRAIHHFAAIIFMLEAVYHLVVIGYKLLVLRLRASLLPGSEDVIDGIQSLLYNLGVRKELPRMDRFNFAEKLEYWAMIWGLVMMSLTGFMLWNPIATTHFLPGEFIPAAKSAHGNEAVLAVLAILVWHFYNVHLRHWNWSMFTGKLTRKEMEEEHPLELEAIESGASAVRPAPRVQSRRLAVYAPVALLASAGLIFGIYKFTSFENTAIKTIPPAITGVAVYVKQTPSPIPTQPPAPTTAPLRTLAPGATAGLLTWDTGIGQVFADNCKTCHGNAGGLNLGSYANAMQGGADGPVIIAGDPAISLLIQKMSGSHPRTLSPAALAQVEAWIKAGAPEK